MTRRGWAGLALVVAVSASVATDKVEPSIAVESSSIDTGFVEACESSTQVCVQVEEAGEPLLLAWIEVYDAEESLVAESSGDGLTSWCSDDLGEGEVLVVAEVDDGRTASGSVTLACGGSESLVLEVAP